MTGGLSSNYRQSGPKSEAYNGQNRSFSIDGSDEEDFVIKILETEPTDNVTEVGHGAPLNAIPHEIENAIIITQNSSDAHNSNNE